MFGISRTGIILLHPIEGAAGAAARRGDGRIGQAAFQNGSQPGNRFSTHALYVPGQQFLNEGSAPAEKSLVQDFGGALIL